VGSNPIVVTNKKYSPK